MANDLESSHMEMLNSTIDGVVLRLVDIAEISHTLLDVSIGDRIYFTGNSTENWEMRRKLG